MTRRQLIGLAGAGSAGLLLAALCFQAIGYAPCDLCILQRWPHLAAAIIAAVAWVSGRFERAFAWLGALAAGLATGFALYHTGVEQKWWQGPTTCTSATNIQSMSTTDLLAQIQAAPLVRCDEISWHFMGMSMAAWNAVCSAILLAIWLIAALKRR